MINVGLSEDGLYAYEGSGRYGHPVWPSPIVFRALLIENDDDWKRIPPPGTRLSLLFREDFFDPATRIRRGRLYDGTRHQPADWLLLPHPALGAQDERKAADNGGRASRMLETFDMYQGLNTKPRRGVGLVLALGTSDASSAWDIVAVERLFSGEDLLTLRARTNFGVLPEINLAAVPARALARLKTALTAVVDANFRESATAVVDRCRDAAQIAIWESLAHDDGDAPPVNMELAALCGKLEARPEPPRMLVTCGRLIAQLHARAKPTEQLRYGKQAPDESAAATAVGALGMILQELNWART